MIRYHIQVDWDEDGDFDRPEETLDSDAIGASWALGLDETSASVAAPSFAEVVLRDPAGRYAPENPSGPLAGSLLPRRKLVISAEQAGETRPLFTGWIESITPRPGRTAVLRCAGVEVLLQRAEVSLPPGVDQTADGVIAAALAQVAYPPAIGGYWLLGTARLGQATRLPDVTVYADLEPGRGRFAAVDALRGSAWDVIRRAAEAERGLCFVDRAGRVVFWNRHHLLKAVDVSAALDERAADFQVDYAGADLVNEAAITCHPRAAGTSPEPLWTLGAPLRLAPGVALTVQARLRNAAGLPVGALRLIAPEPGLDYSANARPDGSGLDVTAQVSITLEAAATSARLIVTHTGPQAAYLLAGAQVRGLAWADPGPLTLTHTDAESRTRYGRRAQRLDLPLLADAADAARLARWLVCEGRTPRGVVREVTLHSASDREAPGLIVGRTVGDRVRIEDAASRHRADYHIVGERHRLQRGGLDHTVTWTLRPATLAVYWRLGTPGAGELGAVTRLTY